MTITPTTLYHRRKTRRLESQFHKTKIDNSVKQISLAGIIYTIIVFGGTLLFCPSLGLK